MEEYAPPVALFERELRAIELPVQHLLGSPTWLLAADLD